MRFSGVLTPILLVSGPAALAGVLSIAYWDTLVGDDSVSTVIRNIGLVAVAAAGLLVGAWRTMATHKEANAALTQARSAQTQADASFRQADTLFQQYTQKEGDALAQRFRLGAEMLGDPSVHVRLGGMRVLFHIAIENKELYGKQVQDLLGDFIYIRKQPVDSLDNHYTFDEKYGRFEGPADAYRAFLLQNELREYWRKAQ